MCNYLCSTLRPSFSHNMFTYGNGILVFPSFTVFLLLLLHNSPQCRFFNADIDGCPWSSILCESRRAEAIFSCFWSLSFYFESSWKLIVWMLRCVFFTWTVACAGVYTGFCLVLTTKMRPTQRKLSTECTCWRQTQLWPGGQENTFFFCIKKRSVLDDLSVISNERMQVCWEGV